MERINKFLEKTLIKIGVGLFIIFIAVVFLQVIARNYLKLSMFWTQEIALLSFIWSVFLGGAIAVRQRKHYIVEIISPEKFPKVSLFLDIFASLISFIVIYVFLYSGLIFVQMGMTRYSRVLLLPMAYFFMPFPVAGFFMTLFNIENIIEDIRRIQVLFKER